MAWSYAAVRAKAARARRRRVSSVSCSCSRSSASTLSYSPGSTTTPTWAWFLAAARTIAGPPTSISSIPGSSANGYRLTTTSAIGSMP